MEVLKKSKFILRLGNVANKRGVYLYKWRIPNFIVDLLVMMPMFLCSIQMLIVCFNIGPRLKEISSCIYLMLGISSILAIYICLAAKNDMIIATLDHLQEMVTLSKSFLWIGILIHLKPFVHFGLKSKLCSLFKWFSALYLNDLFERVQKLGTIIRYIILIETIIR